jgi:hypothetical protein
MRSNTRGARAPRVLEHPHHHLTALAPPMGGAIVAQRLTIIGRKKILDKYYIQLQINQTDKC